MSTRTQARFSTRELQAAAAALAAGQFSSTYPHHDTAPTVVVHIADPRRATEASGPVEPVAAS